VCNFFVLAVVVMKVITVRVFFCSSVPGDEGVHCVCNFLVLAVVVMKVSTVCVIFFSDGGGGGGVHRSQNTIGASPLIVRAACAACMPFPFSSPVLV
jgi:hypothetical protein